MGRAVSSLELAEGRMREVIAQPELSAKDRCECPPRLRQARTMATEEEWHRIAAGLRQRNIAALLEGSDVIWHAGEAFGAGLFGVPQGKKERCSDGVEREVLRTITNFQLANELHEIIEADIAGFPFLGQWAMFRVELEEQLQWSSEDVRCCFCISNLLRAMWGWPALAKTVPWSAFGIKPPGSSRKREKEREREREREQARLWSLRAPQTVLRG